VFNLQDYLDLVADTTEKTVLLSPASVVLLNALSSTISVNSFRDDGAALTPTQKDELDNQLAQMFTEINTDADCIAECAPFELHTLQTLYGLGLPLFDYTADNVAITMGVRFQATVAGYVQGIRYWNTSTEWDDGVKVALYTNTGTKLQEQNLAINQLGWSYARLNPPILIPANTLYVAAVYTPNTGWSMKLNALSATFTNGNLKILADGSGGKPTCPTRLATGLGFPTTSSGGARVPVDIEFTVDV